LVGCNRVCGCNNVGDLCSAFIGGWVALKFAVGWQRYAGEAEAGGAMVALIGNVISFAVAIAIGLTVNPSALETWAKTSH
jgi:hypothetical protein